MPTDPICGMSVDAGPDALQLTRENRTYYFCSTSCLRSFADPDEERRRLGRRLVVAWPLSISIVLLTYGVGTRDAAFVSAGLAVVVQGYSGAPFYAGAGDAVRRRIGNMDLLIAVGTSAAYGESLAALLLPGRLPPVYYFDASAMIVTLILTGSYLEHLTRLRAGSAVRRLGELLPAEAWVVRDGQEQPVPLASVSAGDVIRIRPGARIPVDGAVRSGRSSAEEAMLTGEPLPVAKAPGDPVLAGTLNREGPLEVEVRSVGPDTFVGQVGALLSEAEMGRVPLQQLADRIASRFVPCVLLIAIGAALAWGLAGGIGLSVAILIFVTVAITACPCAFGIATPAAILVGTGRAAEQGILFRGGDALERTSRVDLVLADKTGTLTTSEPTVASLQPVAPGREAELLSRAAGLSRSIDHPLSAAIRREASRRGVAAEDVTGLVADPGRGVRGSWNGRPVAFLRGDVARAEGVDLTGMREWIASAETAGDSWSVVVDDGSAVGGISFRATIVPGAREAVAALSDEGIPVVIVTGDSEAAARRVARELGITSVHANADPATKVALVERYRGQGRTVGFVGDGINDAPALSAADVGFAIGSGTEVAREAGQVLLVRSDLRGVPEGIRLARRTVARVRQNLRWAIGYNSVLIPVAAGLLVPWLGPGMYRWLPIVGALAMGLSSTTVVLNSLSLRRPDRAGTTSAARSPSPAPTAGAPS